MISVLWALDGDNLNVKINVEMHMNAITFPISADSNELKKSLISADNQYTTL